MPTIAEPLPEYIPSGLHTLRHLPDARRRCWTASDGESGLQVLVKFAADQRQNQAGDGLYHEANVLKQVCGSWFPTLLRSDLHGDKPWMLYEVNGRPLSARLETSALSIPTAVLMLRQCLEGLQVLSLAGYAHGSICPDTIWMDDFGSVQFVHLESAVETDRPGSSLSLISEDQPSYIAPQCFQTDTKTASIDIFAAAVLFLDAVNPNVTNENDLGAVRFVRRQDAHNRVDDLPLVAELSEILYSMLEADTESRETNLERLIADLVNVELMTMADRFRFPALQSAQH